MDVGGVELISVTLSLTQTHAHARTLLYHSVFLTPHLAHTFSLRQWCVIVQVWRVETSSSQVFPPSFMLPVQLQAGFQSNQTPAALTD